ncbi:MAG: hypothetical protein H7239_08025 [Flavobacterium sp.]|nr:hypothetical protein [Flavobacterium sp.]
MKKYLAIALLVLYLMSTTELNQLLKLPALVEHYNEHQLENSSLTFFEFLHMHYSQADDHDGDKDKDMKLPFKSHSLCCSANPVIVTLPELYVFTSNLVIESSRKEVNYYRFLICPSPLKSIWQPPKIC